jgi:hypothetical protein
VRKKLPTEYSVIVSVQVQQVLQVVEREPTLSTRLLVARVGTSHASGDRTLREEQLYHYHIQSVQELVPHDAPARRVFSQRSESFFFRILLNRTGITNIHNHHAWSDQNPQAIRFHHQRRELSVNLWAKLLGYCFTGPHILPPLP